MADKKGFSHFDDSGKARMVDITTKEDSRREATAGGTVSMEPETYDMIRAGNAAKGDVLGVARIAGIMAAKKVDSLIPLCHPLKISSISVDFHFQDDGKTVGIETKVTCTGKTGVEMEALTAVSVAALTLYDMCKSVDRSMRISDIRLLRKSGGKSGDFVRKEQ